jgi:glycosyltransferase involved in cell wall biosynthesis
MAIRYSAQPEAFRTGGASRLALQPLDVERTLVTDPEPLLQAHVPTTRQRRRITVVGSGTRFMSGISLYTLRLANALADAGHPTSLLAMRQLLPTALYPGRRRVGLDLTETRARRDVPTYDGVDWYWLPSLFGAFRFLARQRPEVVVLQWWTGAVLHSYLALAVAARLLGARVVIEFHEVQDTGEARLPLVGRYTRLVGGAVVRLASGYTVHSGFDERLMRGHWPLHGKPVAVVPHGLYDGLHRGPDDPMPPLRQASTAVTNLLFFGVIRPYKGLEDLVRAFDLLTDEEVGAYWLTVVGETFVDRYVPDAELDAYLRGADAVVLPYRRSSISGPLHVAMGYGSPVVMTDTGGNLEAADGYDGLLTVPVADPVALRDAIRKLPALRGRRFSHARSWGATVDAYDQLLDRVFDAARPLPARVDLTAPAARAAPRATSPAEERAA